MQYLSVTHLSRQGMGQKCLEPSCSAPALHSPFGRDFASQIDRADGCHAFPRVTQGGGPEQSEDLGL